jgi:hypothetical protein
VTSAYKPPLEMFQDWWGDKVTARSVGFLANAPQDHWFEFSEHYLDARPGQVDDLIKGSMTAYCSVHSRTDDLYDPELIPLSTARVRALSLYAEHVLVSDPFTPLALDFYAASRGPHEEPPHPQKVKRCLELLVELSPLAEAGSVLFPRARNASGDGGEAGSDSQLTLMLATVALNNEINDSDRGSWTDGLDLRWMTDPNKLSGGGSPILAALNLIGNITAARCYSDSGSIFIGTPLERSVLGRLVALCGEEISSRATRLANLATLAVPIIIPSADNVAIAREASEFSSFRTDLSRALRAVEEIPSSDEKWLGEGRALMADELSGGQARIAKVVRDSQLLSSMKRVGGGIAMSALGATTAAQVGGTLLPSLTAASVTAIGTAIGAHLSSRRQARENRAVLESYMMFDPSGHK